MTREIIHNAKIRKSVDVANGFGPGSISYPYPASFDVYAYGSGLPRNDSNRHQMMKQ